MNVTNSINSRSGWDSRHALSLGNSTINAENYNQTVCGLPVMLELSTLFFIGLTNLFINETK